MATKINRLTDVTMEVDPPYTYIRFRDEEQRARWLENWVKELEDFIRDHRSQDPVSLHVVRKYEDVCSSCQRPWETYTEDGRTFCAYCGEEVGAE